MERTYVVEGETLSHKKLIGQTSGNRIDITSACFLHLFIVHFNRYHLSNYLENKIIFFVRQKSNPSLPRSVGWATSYLVYM